MKKILLVIGLLLLMGCTSADQKKNKEHHLIRGMNYSKSGNYTKAIDEYKYFYEIDKKDPILLREMGLAYAQLGDYGTAEKYYLEAIKLDPKDQITLSNMAILSYKMGKLRESRYYLSQISSDSIDYKIYLLKGYIAYDEKKYEDAYLEFTKVLNLIKIEDYTFVGKYVEILQKTNRTNEIYPFIYKVYEVQKNDPDAVITYSRFLIDVFNDYDGALKALKTYIAREKNNRVILEVAKRSFEMGKINDTELYLKLLTDAYKYDLDVLNLKKEIAVHNNKPADVKKYQKIIEKVSDLDSEEYQN
ncbi:MULTISPECIES: tetratricopeptide repeat protein [Psychrilyobacter]|uniref:Tetratricopeptide repeat protein n=1 Tax=Psychrilyobacter piezotolerans TaxID=2293438 RepID=A0ABX9KER7_9FUSO|nr:MULTISPECIES: tetratricopeptide repeat protein [Psychrilyobacter]MCS5421324.1 tetratricopeptide repeat protein [Psychrilyobacter sp. S5]NDI78346.1 tetratricopeptide repeat protein [Psychrilyobacter piezotolerans]RDE59693.1 tetratricopeptide repeat protein [Psychrilyobacter sp. S5]REI40069.1 tetratricopeptide repeat protein [Psychrilyobacter piezotolerans]